MPTIRIPKGYQKFTLQSETFHSTETSFQAIFSQLISAYPALVGNVFDGSGKLFPFVRVVEEGAIVNDEDIFEKKVSQSATIFLINAVAGG